MAIDGYSALALTPCIDNDSLGDAFGSISALIGEMNKGTTDIACDSINVEVEGRTGRGESCVTIFEAETLNPNGVANEKCLFIGSFVFDYTVRGTVDGFIEAFLDYQIKCDGLTVASGTAHKGVVFASYTEANCKRGSKVELCGNVRYTQSGLGSSGSPIEGLDWTFQMCGGRMCFTERDVRQAGAYVPCTVDPNCKYGFEAIALIAQNLNSLCTAFSFGGKTARAKQVLVNDNDAVAVQLNLSSDTVFLTFATLEVCFDNDFPVGDSVLIEPVIGCPDNPVQCISARLAPIILGGGRTKQCFQVPVVTCGFCKAGEDLYVGQSQILQCNPVPVDTSPNYGYTVKGEYCVWLFEDVNNVIEQVPMPPRCLSQEYMQRLIDKGEAVHTLACNISRPNCTIRTKKLFDEMTFRGDFSPFLIQEAIPFTPPIDDPAAVAGRKKWFISGGFTVCSERPSSSTEEYSFGVASWELYCGGVPYVSALTGDVVGGSCEWNLAGSGNFYPCSPLITVSGNIECPTDQPLEIVTSITTNGLGVQGGDWSVTGEIEAICF